MNWCCVYFFGFIIIFCFSSNRNHHLQQQKKFISTKPLLLNKQEKKEEIRSNNDISSFREDEYECTGSCYCIEEENENYSVRSSSSGLITLKRSLVLIVASISSFSAYEKAKQYFYQECKNKKNDFFSSSSSSCTIKSEIIDCKPKKKEIITEESSSSSSLFKVPNKKKKKDIIKYFCKGNCMVNLKLRIAYTIEKAKEFGCEELKREGEIEMDMTKIKKVQRNHFARLYFLKNRLTKFCKDNSLHSYLRTSPSGKKNTLIVKMCVGSRANASYTNQSVRCIQIDPKPNFTNRKYWDEID